MFYSLNSSIGIVVILLGFQFLYLLSIVSYVELYMGMRRCLFIKLRNHES